MLKPFCDICGSEITVDNEGLSDDKVVRNLGVKLLLQVVLKSENVHICKYCICSEISKALDDRLKAEVR